MPTVFGKGKISIDKDRSGAYDVVLVKLANGVPVLAE
jgi:hypothetical protein